MAVHGVVVMAVHGVEVVVMAVHGGVVMEAIVAMVAVVGVTMEAAEGAASILVNALRLMLMLNLTIKHELVLKVGSCYHYK